MELAGLKIILDGCSNCGLCQKECTFLKEFGTPRELASSVHPSVLEILRPAFLCSLCGLCAAICPKSLKPHLLFLEMRRLLVAKAPHVLKPYGALRRFESIGKSTYFNLKILSPGTDTVFFPGCSLSGTRPATVQAAFEMLRGEYPNCGIVLDCCSKPSHDLGAHQLFEMRFFALRDELLEARVRRVVVACPNCYKVFSKYGASLQVVTIYEVLAQALRGRSHKRGSAGEETYTIHDPCSIRFHKQIHEAIRIILDSYGIPFREMPHSREKTYCCGEGGGVFYRRAGLSRNWTQKRLQEAGHSTIITYCAGCANMLGRVTVTHHLLDLVFRTKQGIGNKARVGPPVTYFNRLLLKWRLKHLHR